MPTACAAMPMRPVVKVPSALLKPWPSPPSRSLAGKRTSSNARSTVLLVWMPSFSVTFSTTMPGKA
jgi:hypothetical protein